MTISDFRSTLNNISPPNQLNQCLLALWYDAKNDWQKAHSLVDSATDTQSAWVHAYLHRKEGDIGNARYWYARAGKLLSTQTFEKEWEAIVTELLQKV